ncbi:MAG: peptidoglycan binding protein CsiV [Gammaproteobacteria bacterium]|nr:peptidoglycan binding protein CsiV [Gammaproteobacteria bacterium]MCF6229417.1 peptidoglycan binding protein CsiV [Gammaproteobacteria bacterium]
MTRNLFTNNSAIKHLLLISLLLCSNWLQAESEPAPWYEVEIILFERNSKQEPFHEVLNQRVITPELIDTLELTPPFKPGSDEGKAVETAYQQLTKPQLQLSTAFKSLKRNPAYKPLLHIGWRQPGLSRELAPAILIYPYATERQISVESYLGLIDERGKTPPPPDEQTAVWREQSHIFGYIRLSLSRYLHVESDLLLSKPAKVVPHQLLLNNISTRLHTAGNGDYFNSPDQLLTPLSIPLRQPASLHENHYFRIDENRRVRKQELHYFDHPRFGMLLVVRDYTPPVEEVEEAEQAATEPATGTVP